MTVQDFIGGNNRIEIISGSGAPTAIPQAWQPILTGCEVLVVIPDMHMTPNTSALDNFKWGADAMLDMLTFLGNKKDLLDDPGDLKLVQLGDLYELRFPGSKVNSTVTDIRRSNDKYALILDTLDDLNVNKMYGNHDFENRHFDGYNFYYSIGKVYLEHGFAADTWMANPLNPLNDPTMLVFLKVRELNEFFDSLGSMIGLDMSDKTYSWGVTSGNTEVKSFPSDADYLKDYKNIKDYYITRMKAKAHGPDSRITIIGHTHAPHLDITINDGENMYIDCGGWTEGRSDFLILTNEEAAICHYNRNAPGPAV